MKKFYVRLWAGPVAALLTACVPQAFQQTDFRSHLTRDERQELKAGRPVDKVHVSYWRFRPRQVYWQGPLRAEADRSGRVRFTPHGTWSSYYIRGAAKDTTVYGTDDGNYTVRFYRENGDLYVASTTVRTQREGRPFSESVDVEFRAGNRRDTASLRRWGSFESETATVLDERIEFDPLGRRGPLQKIK